MKGATILQIFIIQIILLILARIISRKKYVSLSVLSLGNLFILSNSATLFTQATDILDRLNRSSLLFALIFISIAIYGIFEIYEILGLNNKINDTFKSLSTKGKQFFMLFLSFFATNIDLDDIDYLNEHRETFNPSSFFTSTLNILAIINIPLIGFLFFLEDTFISSYNILLAMVFFNFFAIIWVIKKVIDISFGKYIVYNHYEHEEKKIQTLKVADNVVLISRGFIILSLLIAFILGAGVFMLYSYFVGVGNVLSYFVIALGILLVGLFLFTEYRIHKTKFVTENEFIRKLLHSYKNITKTLIEFILSLILFGTNLKLYGIASSLLVNHKITILLIIVLTSFIFTYLSRNYLLSFAIFIPLAAVYLDNDFLQILIVINVIYFSYFLSIIHLSYKNKMLVSEIGLVGILGGLAYLSYIFTQILYLSYVLIIVVLIVYTIGLIVKKENYDDNY